MSWNEFPPSEVEGYLADQYGSCRKGDKCECLRPGNPWIGTGCLDWEPLGVKTFQELYDVARIAMKFFERRRESATESEGGSHEQRE